MSTTHPRPWTWRREVSVRTRGDMDLFDARGDLIGYVRKTGDKFKPVVMWDCVPDGQRLKLDTEQEAMDVLVVMLTLEED